MTRSRRTDAKLHQSVSRAARNGTRVREHRRTGVRPPGHNRLPNVREDALMYFLPSNVEKEAIEEAEAW